MQTAIGYRPGLQEIQSGKRQEKQVGKRREKCGVREGQIKRCVCVGIIQKRHGVRRTSVVTGRGGGATRGKIAVPKIAGPEPAGRDAGHRAG